MPPVVDPANLYSETAAGKLSPAVAGDLPRVYVPNVKSNDVYVIDPATFKVVDKFKVGINPQHVVPSWDLRTLWVANNAEGRTRRQPDADRPEDRQAGHADRRRRPVQHVFTPDGKSAIVVAEAYKRLDFRDPQTMALQSSLDVPRCGGINHADFSIDGRFAIFTCEFDGTVAKIDLVDAQGAGLPPADQARPADDDRSRASTAATRSSARRGRACRRTSASRRTASCSSSPT